MKNILKKRVIRDEKGQAMFLTVILLLVGGLIVSSLLAYMGNGLLNGRVYEGRVAELYGADAGVEAAVWKIQHQTDIPTGCAGCTTRSYTIADVNGREVEFSITRVNNVTLVYQVLSTAISDDGSSTTVEADVETMAFDLLSGALVSSADIVFNKDCTVTGNVYYVGEITGDYEHDVDPVQVPLNVFPTPDQNDAFARQFYEAALLGGVYDENDGNMDIDENQDVGPIYIPGNLDISKDVTINLEGVVYVKGHIKCEKTLVITGEGSLVAEGYIYLSKLANYAVTGDSVIMSLSEEGIYIKKSDAADELSLQAFIYAPYGPIFLFKDMTVVGSVIGAGIEIEKDGSFTYVSKASSFGFPIWVPYGATIKTYSISQN